MEDPFASLTGDDETAQPHRTTQAKSDSPFDELVDGSRSKRTRNRAIYSVFVVVLLLLGVVIVPRVLSESASNESLEADSTNLEAQNMYTPPTDLESFIQKITSSTVIVECAASEEAEYADSGSGFVVNVADLAVDPNLELVIVTNHHVIETCADGGGVLIAGRGDEFSEVKVLDYDIPNDLAIIELGTLKVDPLSMSTNISVGQWVMTSGSPVNIESNVTFGQVTSTSTPSDTGGEDLVASDAVIGPGNSGGPLVNRSGQAIAVNSAIFVDLAGISVSVPVAYLCVSILICKS